MDILKKFNQVYANIISEATIKTKFNVNDEVFYIDAKNNIKSKKILSIQFDGYNQESPDSAQISYHVGYGLYFNEADLFKTEADAKKALEKKSK